VRITVVVVSKIDKVLAFHMVTMAHVDIEFAKEQLILFLREWYMHPNGWCDFCEGSDLSSLKSLLASRRMNTHLVMSTRLSTLGLATACTR